MTNTALDHRGLVREAAVRLVNANGPAGVTMSALSQESGVRQSEMAAEFDGVDDVLAAVLADLGSALDSNMDATILRRRSLTESMQIAFAAYWQVVEARIDEHQAAKQILLHQLSRHDLGEGADRYAAFIRTVQNWLTAVEAAHHITWELPTRQLAQLMLATLEGVTTNFLFTRDSATTHRILDTFAFQLAQHGRRDSKNQMH
jgi:AcrR family transcriptional regulator